MARPKKSPVQKTIKIKRSEFVETIEEAERLRERAKSYNQDITQSVSAFLERTSYDKGCFASVRKLARLDDLKRQSWIEQFIMGCQMMGFMDQGDLFGRAQDRYTNEVEDERARDDGDVRPRFKKNEMPLADAEKKFAENAKAKPPKGAKSDDKSNDASDKKVVGIKSGLLPH